MNTVASVAKDRCVRLQQEIVGMLRAMGGIEGAELFWRRLNFSNHKDGFVAIFTNESPSKRN